MSDAKQKDNIERPTYEEQLGQRLSLIIDIIGSKVKAAEIAGVTDEQLRRWEKGKAKIPFISAHKLCAAANKSLEWLISDETQPPVFGSFPTAGNMFPKIGAIVDHFAKQHELGLIEVPCFNIELSCGSGAFLEAEGISEYAHFSAEWLRKQIGPFKEDNLAIVGVVGDSMEPSVCRGDTLLIDQGSKQLTDNAIYAIRLDDAVMVKRLQKLPDGIKVISDNRFYEPYELKGSQLQQLHIIGRVRWIGKAL